ncbi:MAG: tyrosine-type recombinase/integrase [Caulobacter sp.]
MNALLRSSAMPKGVVVAPARRGHDHPEAYLRCGRRYIPLGAPDAKDFAARLEQALLGPEPAAGSLGHLIWRYQQSPEFRRLAPRTQHDYREQLARIRRSFGREPLSAFDDKLAAQRIFAWRDQRAQSPRRADYGVQVLKALLGWAAGRGLVERNRAAGVPPLYRSDRRYKVWRPEDVEAFLSTAPSNLGLALVLALETGQRQSDLLALQWRDIDGDVISLRQAKTRQDIAVPVTPRLDQALTAAPRCSPFVLLRQDGQPWTSDGGFRNAWRFYCRKAGITDLTFHDLRGTFVTERLAAGWTLQEVAFCTGHSFRNLGCLERYADRGAVARALARRRLALGPPALLASAGAVTLPEGP